MIAFGITASQCTGMPGYGCALKIGERIVPGTQAARDPAAELQRLCRSAGIEARDIDEVRLDCGPGSYVGLRVAVTTAAFLRRFGPARVHVATSLELMAAAALASDMTAPAGFRPVLDGRRNRYHTALLGADRGSLEPVEVPAAIVVDELLQRFGRGQLVLAAGPLHEVLAPAAAKAGADLRVPPEVTVETLFDERIRWRDAGDGELEPLYLMRSYAE